MVGTAPLGRVGNVDKGGQVVAAKARAERRPRASVKDGPKPTKGNKAQGKPPAFAGAGSAPTPCGGRATAGDWAVEVGPHRAVVVLWAGGQGEPCTQRGQSRQHSRQGETWVGHCDVGWAHPPGGQPL